MELNPDNDGVDHINVYSKGKTELGRKLSNFAHTPFELDDKDFSSIEAYWYYRKLLFLGASEEVLDTIRTLYGYAAKEYGRNQIAKFKIPVYESDNEFRLNITRAIQAKLKCNPELHTQLKECTLPLTHYYWYGKVSKYKIIEDKHPWIIDVLDMCKDETFLDLDITLVGYF